MNVGLSKIAETVEQVEEMQKSLAVKSQELQAKNEAANAKLRQMVKDQQEAEKKKVQSQEIQAELEIQTVKIGQKREDVMADLAQVEPAVIDAQQGELGPSYVAYYTYRTMWGRKVQTCRYLEKRRGLQIVDKTNTSVESRSRGRETTQVWITQKMEKERETSKKRKRPLEKRHTQTHGNLHDIFLNQKCQYKKKTRKNKMIKNIHVSRHH